VRGGVRVNKLELSEKIFSSTNELGVGY
jgi:hypothetical protein